MLTGLPAFVLLLLFCAACFAAGYAVARRSGLRRERELSKELADASARYRASMLKQPESAASGESEGPDSATWKENYETMKRAYDTMKEAHDSMRQTAAIYEETSDTYRRAYEEQKAVNEKLLDAAEANKDSAAG